MGKHVLAAVALCLVWVSSSAPVAQERPKAGAGREYPFVAGKYLTADDYEHVAAALGYVDLKPADLSFEKKVALNQRFVLPVCAQCLDNPLSVPKVAEDAADKFGSTSNPVVRARHAASCLSQDQELWSPESMQSGFTDVKKAVEAQAKHDNERKKPANQTSKEEVKRLKDEADAAWEEVRKSAQEACYGGEAKSTQETRASAKLFPTRSAAQLWSMDLMPIARPILRDAKDSNAPTLMQVAGHLPENFAETGLGVPGATVTPFDGDLLAPANSQFRPQVLVAGARLALNLEAMAAFFRSFIRQPKDWELGGEPSTTKGVEGNIIAAFDCPWGKIVIGGMGDNTYEGDDFIAIIDLGGNDIYKGRVASGIGLPGHSPLSFLLDLGGDDRYMGEDFTQGFGFNGVGILWDLGAGNDYYKSRFCSQACGLLGYGELFDDGGDDQYFTDSGSQGAACFGYGHLIDAAGHDTYRGARYVQACALVGGVAVLTDGGGNDLYYAGGKYLHVPLHNDHYQSLSQGFAIGNRNDANPSMGTGGGVALLLDQGNGNDNYIADIYGQGSSYWLSLGMLVDEGGNDNHVLYQYGIGGGIHLSTGIHVDLAGNDTYTDPWGVGLGGAHDYAVGWLIDRAGNDLYQGGGQGQGLNFSFGCLLDCAGNDAHSCAGAGSIGAGHNNDVSLLLDLDGEDFYTVPDVKNGRFTRQGNHGLIYDCPSGGWFPGIDASTLPTKQDPAPKKVKVQHILISFDGCKVPLRNAEQRTEAEAEALARRLLKQTRTKGADWKKLMADWSEDVGGGEGYSIDEVSRKNYVKEFGDTGLSLGVGQIALSAKGPYGWHIIKRVE